jgi:DNA-binding MarR family transcriptional regulator
LSSELKSALPASAAAKASSGSAVNPAQVKHLPAALHAGYLHAFTSSLNSVFVVATAFAAVAFVLSWFIHELPLRETVATGDLVDTYAAPRDTDSLAEIANMIGRLDRREGAREIVTRVAARAGVNLSPAACWLLARLSEPDAPDGAVLAAEFDIQPARLTEACGELEAQGLIERSPDGRSGSGSESRSGYELTAAGHVTLERLTRMGEQRLSDLLEGWRPEEHEDLARLIATIAREFFVDASALCAPLRVVA